MTNLNVRESKKKNKDKDNKKREHPHSMKDVGKSASSKARTVERLEQHRRFEEDPNWLERLRDLAVSLLHAPS